MTTNHIATYCRVCEPACGLIATMSDGSLEKLQPDRDHPVSRGFACTKGLAGVDINKDEDRLNYPMRREADGLVRVSWDDATAEIAERLQAIVARSGSDSVAAYMGNPASFNAMVGVTMPDVLTKLGASRLFSAGTQDTANKFAASTAVFGTPTLHPLPDVRNTDALLLIGSNWRVSKASMISLPNAYREIGDASARGAKIWFVNPRDTESSGPRTGETVSIKPDTDVYFLAALIFAVDRAIGFHPDAEKHGRNVRGLRSFIADYSPEQVSDVCGIDAATIESIARDFATAPAASVHMSTGVNMGRQGTLAYWLVQMLCLVTGNLDVRGGNIPGREVYPAGARSRSVLADQIIESEFGTMRQVPHLPGVLLADYILDAENPIRALVVVAGNPLLSIPGGDRLRDALQSLELLVVIDIYPNATSRYAHWTLPSTDQFEREDINMALLGMQVDPFVNWTPRVVEPAFERREEWWIFARIADALGLPNHLNTPEPENARWARIDHMLSKGGISRQELVSQPRGLAMARGLEPGTLYSEKLQTDDGLIDCRPAVFDEATIRCLHIFGELEREPAHQLKLISRRDQKMHNSWYANLPAMKKGAREANPLAVSPRDAERLKLTDGGKVLAWIFRAEARKMVC
ncbi:molybdopterin-containing oxidoreductase family protein [Gordonia sp. DT30]|uniref:molybdopterin-containing oxidoreductase family protein n=1 Tax=Gordonia sp. DT30 TaxID=3416546 RepID=UPI003CEFA4AB